MFPREFLRHNPLPFLSGKRKKTCPRPERRLGHDRGTDRNRRVSNAPSPIFYLFLESASTLYLKVQEARSHNEAHDASPPPIVDKRQPGPKYPAYGPPPAHCPFLASSLCRACICGDATEMSVVRCWSHRHNTNIAEEEGTSISTPYVTSVGTIVSASCPCTF